jgi:hypothetical protein
MAAAVQANDGGHNEVITNEQKEVLQVEVLHSDSTAPVGAAYIGRLNSIRAALPEPGYSNPIISLKKFVKEQLGLEVAYDFDAKLEEAAQMPITRLDVSFQNQKGASIAVGHIVACLNSKNGRKNAKAAISKELIVRFNSLEYLKLWVPS